MNTDIGSYRLGADAVKFVCGQLGRGGPLSAMLKLSAGGIVWAYLPANVAKLQALKNFEEGGMFDSESAFLILRGLIAFIRAFLQESPSNILLCEDRFFSINDPPNSQEQDIFEWGGVVYHYRTHSFSNADAQEFEEAIGSASNYPLILFLTRTSSPELLPQREKIDRRVADELVKNISHLIVGAY